jgi:dTDP-4-amino-4,6-dideoxygalactose transaminase
MIRSSRAGVPLVDLGWQQQAIAEDVKQGIDRVLATGAFVLGPDVEQFEAEFAAYCGARHCVGVGNGTDAVELALRAVGIGGGDEVIVPANTFVATAGGIRRTGATPVIVDCDPEFLLLDASKISERITSRTRAIVPVHLYGQLAPMPEILDIARRNDLLVIEDAAQSQGADQLGRRAGTWGIAAATSFYPGKNLGAYGDAGGVVTNSATLADSVRALRNHGSTEKYQHPELGFNSRMDTLQAAVLRSKLTRLQEWNELRRDAAVRYAGLLSGLDDVVLPATLPGNVHAWHLYVVQVPDRDRVLAELNEAGIGAGIHYPVPLHLHGAYADLGHRIGDFPVSEQAAGRILSLPIYPGITEMQQARVVAELARALASGRQRFGRSNAAA